MSAKFVNILFSAGCVSLIVSSILKIMHLPYGNVLIIVSIVLGGVASFFYVENLKKRIKQLQQELASHK